MQLLIKATIDDLDSTAQPLILKSAYVTGAKLYTDNTNIVLIITLSQKDEKCALS